MPSLVRDLVAMLRSSQVLRVEGVYSLFPIPYSLNPKPQTLDPKPALVAMLRSSQVLILGMWGRGIEGLGV